MILRCCVAAGCDSVSGKTASTKFQKAELCEGGG